MVGGGRGVDIGWDGSPEANRQRGKPPIRTSRGGRCSLEIETPNRGLWGRTWGGERSSIPCKVFQGLDRRDGNVSDEWSGHERERDRAEEAGRRTGGCPREADRGGTCQGGWFSVVDLPELDCHQPTTRTVMAPAVRAQGILGVFRCRRGSRPVWAWGPWLVPCALLLTRDMIRVFFLVLFVRPANLSFLLVLGPQLTPS